MINPTGLIKTDLLILDICGKALLANFFKKWENILNIHGVPKQFLKIKKYFLRPDFGLNPSAQSIKIKKKILKY